MIHTCKFKAAPLSNQLFFIAWSKCILTGANIHLTQVGVEDEVHQRNAASQVTKSNYIPKVYVSSDGIRSDKISLQNFQKSVLMQNCKKQFLHLFSAGCKLIQNPLQVFRLWREERRGDETKREEQPWLLKRSTNTAPIKLYTLNFCTSPWSHCVSQECLWQTGSHTGTFPSSALRACHEYAHRTNKVTVFIL